MVTAGDDMAAGDVDAAPLLPAKPGAVRYRCSSCGNLTRFDVVATRQTRAFYHFTLAGECRIEDEDVLSELVESVTCRWCGSTAAVEVISPIAG